MRTISFLIAVFIFVSFGSIYAQDNFEAEVKKFTVKFKVANNSKDFGTLEGTTTQKVDSGANCSAVKAVPKSGYKFKKWKNGFSGKQNPLTIKNVTKNLTVAAVFVENKFTVKFVAGKNGKISGTLKQKVSPGGNCTQVTAVPNDGFKFKKWKGGYTGKENPLTVKNVNKNMKITAVFESASKEFTVKFVAGDNGKITGTKKQVVKSGANCTAVKAVPNDKYRFKGWTGDYEGTQNPLTIKNVTKNMKITAKFELTSTKYTVTFVSGDNGKITGTKVQEVESGGNCSEVKAVPNDKYRFKGWTGGYTGTQNPLIVKNVTKNMTITASFDLINTKYKVEFIAGSNGEITGDLEQEVKSGDNCTEVKAVPNDKYRFKGWTGGYTGTQNPLILKNVTKNMSITANFELIDQKYKVKFVAASNGKITGEIEQEVSSGDDCSEVKAVADDKYVFKNWTGDYNGTQNPLVIKNVTKNMKITANFELATVEYTVNFIAGDNGKIKGTKKQVVKSGGNCSEVKAVPNDKYVFKGWTGDYNGKKKKITIKNVTKNMTIKANFEIATTKYTVKFVAGSNGSITGSKIQEVQSGKNCSQVIAVPNDGYRFTKWTGDTTSTKAKLTVKKVTKNMTITANFAEPLPEYTINVVAGENGTTTPSGKQVVKTGDDLEIKATPNDGYNFIKWKASGVSVAKKKSAKTKVKNVQNNGTVTAVFKKLLYKLNIKKAGSGSGTITPSNGQFEPNTKVTLTAKAESNSIFKSWEVNGTKSTNNPLEITMNDHKQVLCTFEKDIKITSKASVNPSTQWIGQSVTFNIGATSAHPITYQWKKGNSAVSGELTNPKYTFTVKKGDEGKYHCLIKNKLHEEKSRIVTLKVSKPVKIIREPYDLTGWTGRSVRFIIRVDGTPPIVCRWQKRQNNGEWKHTGSSDQGQSFQINKLTMAHNNTKYRCIVNDNGGNQKISRAATLKMRKSISITKHPKDKEAWIGETVTFRIETEGDKKGIRRYWLHNGNVIQGSGGEELEVIVNNLSNGGKYSCRIIDGGKSRTESKTAILKVNESARFTKHPTDKYVSLGGNASFNVEAMGNEPLTYQWYFFGNKIDDENSKILDITNVTQNHVGEYSCEVKNPGGSVRSDTATLRVIGIVSIKKQPQNYTAFTGSDHDATFKVIANGSNPNYQWEHNNVKIPGAVFSKLTIDSIELKDAGMYRCSVWNNLGHVKSDEAELIVRRTVQITKQPPNFIMKKKGETARFSITALGYGNISYQWQKKIGSTFKKLVGETKSHLEYTNLKDENSGIYRCQATNGGGTVYSHSAHLYIEGEIKIIDDLDSIITGWTGNECQLSFTVSGTPPIDYKWYKVGKINPLSEEKDDSTNNPTHTINNCNKSDSGKYFCIVDNYAKKPDTSITTELIVKKTATITKHPQHKHVKQGETVKMTVEADGDDAVTYFWLKDGSPKFQYNSNVLKIDTVTSSNSGQWQCVVSNKGGSDTSKIAKLIVDGSIKITSPKSGYTWMPGKIKEIKWVTPSNEEIKKVKIEFSKNGGQTYVIITSNEDNKGSFRWKVPNVISSFCKIRISKATDEYISDESDGFFTIDVNPIINKKNDSKLFSQDQFQVFPNPIREKMVPTVFFNLVSPIKIINREITIYDALGNTIFILPNINLVQNNKKYNLGSWNLKNMAGDNVSNGSYLSVLSITDKNGRKHILSKIIGIYK